MLSAIAAPGTPLEGRASLWLGPTTSEARAAYHRARSAGMTAVRALVIGNVASFRDCWAFRSRLAEKVGCSVRTVARALRQARSLGLIGVARAKQGEKPPGLTNEVPCGWSHRWTIGWGRAGELVRRAVDAARAKWILRHTTAARTSPAAPRATEKKERAPSPPARKWTADELDRELERLERERPREKPK